MKLTKKQVADNEIIEENRSGLNTWEVRKN